MGDNYIMLYESHGGTRYAKSSDGIRWRDAGWLVEKSGADVDRHGHVTPFLLTDIENNAWLFFGAASAASWDRNCIAVIPVVLKAPNRESRQNNCIVPLVVLLSQIVIVSNCQYYQQQTK